MLKKVKKIVSLILIAVLIGMWIPKPKKHGKKANRIKWLRKIKWSKVIKWVKFFI